MQCYSSDIVEIFLVRFKSFNVCVTCGVHYVYFFFFFFCCGLQSTQHREKRLFVNANVFGSVIIYHVTCILQIVLKMNRTQQERKKGGSTPHNKKEIFQLTRQIRKFCSGLPIHFNFTANDLNSEPSSPQTIYSLHLRF